MSTTLRDRKAFSKFEKFYQPARAAPSYRRSVVALDTGQVLEILMPGQVGRPSLFEERSPKFLEQIENGLPTRAAAARAALHVDTVMDWLAKGREQKSGKFTEFFEQYTRARGVALANSIERIRVLGCEDWRSEFALAERMFPKDLGKPGVQLNLQNNVTNIAAEFTINVTGERAEKIDSRAAQLHARTLSLFDRDNGQTPAENSQ
jgi:hypothetical protein